MQKQYIALIERDNEAGFGVVFPDLPGCITSADTYEDAIKNAHEVLAFYAETENMPEPRTLEQIQETWEPWQEWKDNYNFTIAMITLFPTFKSNTRINIMIDKVLLTKIDMITKNRSEFINKAISNYFV